MGMSVLHSFYMRRNGTVLSVWTKQQFNNGTFVLLRGYIFLITKPAAYLVAGHDCSVVFANLSCAVFPCVFV